MRKVKQTTITISTILLLVLCIAADIVAARWLVSGSGWIFVVSFIGHLLLSTIFVLLLYVSQKTEEMVNFNFLLIALAVTCAIPAYSMPGLAMVYVASRKAKFVEDDYFEFDETLAAHQLDEVPRELSEDIVGFMRAEQNIDALKDIFLSGDQRLEEIAIQKLNRVGNKSAVSILQSVLSQSSSDVKILAASALIAIEEKTVEKIAKLQELLKKEPMYTKYMLELARAFDLYCHLGVLDDSLLQYYQNLGIEKFSQYCTLVPGDEAATVEFGRLLLKAGRQAEAEAVFVKLIQANPDDLNPRIWLAEVYYTLQKYDKVKAMCREIKSIGNVPDIYADTVNWWTRANTDDQLEVAAS
ncbi:MAG: tetratricopeptide repeat protein [Calditrichaeota bacterium]|nr:MAG: tetratricopeptide repeat protein [Calditrichota bacterium]